jgi:hypothetical protein
VHAYRFVAEKSGTGVWIWPREPVQAAVSLESDAASRARSVRHIFSFIMVNRFPPEVASCPAKRQACGPMRWAPVLPRAAIPAASMVGVMIVSVKTQTAGDTGTGHVADHTAGEKTRPPEQESPRGRTKRAIEQALASARCCRRQ